MPSEDSSASNGRSASPLPDDASIEHVLDHYLQQLAHGRQPDQDDYLARFPRLADALRGVFKTLDFVETTSRSLHASELQRGQQLAEYRIVREVARGGMGVVYEAVQTSLGRRVALKVLPTGAMLSGSAAERFTREAATAGQLHHSGIVPVYAVGQCDGIHYYAMQFIEGHSLSEHIKRMRAAGIRPDRDYFRRVAHWGQQAAEALGHAHANGTIHRDIKPSNLLLDARDNVWITDFGLARADAHTTLTLTGDVVGTARYMSPEQARGGREPIDQRTDIYSLGATLYELLTLRPVYEGESRDAVLNQIALTEPRPLRRIDAAIPRDLETIVGKCMEREPARRYELAGKVAEDCRRLLEGEPIRARRMPLLLKAAHKLRRHRLASGAAIVVLVLLAVIAVVVVRERRERGRRLVDEALVAMLEHETARAAELLDQATALGTRTPRLEFYRALAPLLSGQPREAIAPLERAFERNPEDVDCGYALAYAYYAMADGINGNRYFHKSNARPITSALGWLLRGHALGQLDSPEAIECFNRATALQHDFTPAIEARAYLRGNVLLTAGDRTQYEPMMDDFNAWVIFRPDSPRSFFARGTGWVFAAAYARTQPDLAGEVDRMIANALRDLDRAEGLSDGQSAVVQVRRGVLLRFVGDFRGSAEAFGRALPPDREQAGRQQPGVVHHRALALHALGEVNTALEELAPACDAIPSFFGMTLHRAILLAEAGRLDEARAACRETMAHQRHNGTATLMTAAVLELLGDAEAASRLVREFDPASEPGDPANATSRPAPHPGLAYFSGHADPALLLSDAGVSPDRRCEYSFLIGLRELGRGRRAAGLRALRDCLDTGVFIFAHYRLAQVLLARAEADPAWPHWPAGGPANE